MSSELPPPEPGWVVHPHLHGRRTGVTRHVETVVPLLGRVREARVIGSALRDGLPRITWRELLRRARRTRLVWHAHRVGELVAGLFLRALGGRVSLVFTRHSDGRPGLTTRWAMRRADAVVALTAHAARQLDGFDPCVVGHGVDLRHFGSPEDRAASFAALSLGGKWGVGVLGRVRPAKGQGDFIQAVAPLLSERSQWRAVVVGRVKARDRRWAQKLGRLAPGVIWVDEQQDVRPWLQGLSIVVQPSHRESYSLVLMEAMASGCCVVAARLPHYGQFLEDGVTGRLYEPGNAVALRQVLAELMDDPERAHHLGAAAAARAREAFGAQREALALDALYAQVLEREG